MGAVAVWLLGWVRLEIRSPALERWFNLCGAHGLPFQQVEMRDAHTVRLTIPRFRLAQARALAEQAMAEWEVVGQGGLPSLLPRLGGRLGLAAGGLLFLLLVTVLGRVVMVIDVEGNVSVPDAAIVALLQRCGFGVGSYGPAVDVRELSNRALMEMEELAFLAVDLNGIRARVVVREADPVPELAPTAPADVAAARDGFLVKVDVISGQARYRKGDAVLRGETVISHTIQNESRDGTGAIVSTQTVRARGEVWALTRRTLSAAVPLEADAPGTGGRTGWAMEILGRRLNFYGNTGQRDRECGKITCKSSLHLRDGTPLPFGWWKTQWLPRSSRTALDPAAGEAFLRQLLRTRLEQGLQGQVLSLAWETDRQTEVVTVTLQASCLEQIGVTVELPPEEP